jgi:hypothetical protein
MKKNNLYMLLIAFIIIAVSQAILVLDLIFKLFYDLSYIVIVTWFGIFILAAVIVNCLLATTQTIEVEKEGFLA